MSDITCIDNNKRDGLQVFLKPVQAIGSQMDDIAFFGIVWTTNPVKKGFISGLNEKTAKEIIGLYHEATETDSGQKMTEPEKIFDESLRKLNAALVKYPIKKDALNLLFGLKFKNKILFTYVGKIFPVLVERKSRGEINVSPLGNLLKKGTDKRFFPKFVSGILDFHQSIFFSTDNISTYFTPLRLGTLLFASSNALWQIKNSISKLDPKLPFAALHILYKSKESSTSLSSMENLIATEARTGKIISPPVFPNLTPAFKKAASFLASKTFALLQWSAQKISQAWQEMQTNRRQQKSIAGPLELEPEDNNETNGVVETTEAAPSEDTLEYTARPAVEDDIEELVEIRENEDETEVLMVQDEILTIESAPRQKKNLIVLWSSVSRAILINLFKIFRHLARTLKKLDWKPDFIIERFNALPLKKKVLFISLSIIIFLFAQSLLFLNLSREAKGLADNADKIEQNITASKAGLIYGDEVKALDFYNLANGDFITLSQNPRLKKETKNKLTDELNALKKTLRHEVDLSAKLLLEFQNQKKPTRLLMIDNDIYLLSENSLLKFNQANSSLEVVYQNTSISFEKFSLDNDKHLIFLAGANTIVEFNIKNKSTVERQINLTNLRDLTVYNSKIYLLAGQPLNLTRLTPTQGGFTVSPWLKEQIDLPGVKSLAIDGYVYLMKQDGTMLKLLNGRQKSLNLAKIDPALSNPTKILTFIDNDYFYILDGSNQRLIIFNKKGDLQTQYLIGNVANIIDFAVNEKTKKVILLDDKGIFEITLP